MKKDKINLEKEGKLLPIIEDFYTLQGEGYHTGKPAHFIRIGGCDIACHFCDTKFSWKADLIPLVKTEEIIEKIKKSKAKSLVITGGEPLMYNLDFLCNTLQKYNFQLFLETSGAYSISGVWDWICLSPKQQKPPLDKEIYQKANELKIIIEDEDDFNWAEINAKKVQENCKLFLQAEWSKSKKIIPIIVEYIKKNTKWSLSIQTHKYINIP